MEVVLNKSNEILIVAETEFERSFCENYDENMFKAVLKTGSTASEVIGLRLIAYPKDDSNVS